MGLLTKIKYETAIKSCKDITPENILTMLRDVRSEIGKLQPTFAQLNLTEVLTVVENENYIVQDTIPTQVNLSNANSAVKAYRKGSEGGCQSCVNLNRETIDAQDASSGLYCGVFDPDYNQKTGVRLFCRSRKNRSLPLPLLN